MGDEILEGTQAPPRAETLARKFGMPTDEHLAKINRFTKRAFTKEEVFAFPVKMIGDAMIPNRFIKLHPSLLEMYAKDGQNGNVAYMLNHRWTAWFGLGDQKGVITLGRVFDSWMEPCHDLPDETVAQYGMVYLPRDRTKDGVSTNEVIESVEDGSLRDHSVGIGWSVSECSICGKDYRSPECPHVAGRTYEEGGLAYIVAKPPGDQFELSGVFAGAYPTAEVMGANAGETAERSAGSMQPVALEDFKRVPEGAQVFAFFSDHDVTLFVRKGAVRPATEPFKGSDAGQVVASLSIGAETDGKGGEKVDEVAKKTENQLSEAMAQANLSEADMLKVVETLTKAATQLETTPGEIVARLENLTPEAMNLANTLAEGADTLVVLRRDAVRSTFGKDVPTKDILLYAKDGHDLREREIEETATWRVRAEGNTFDADAYRDDLRAGAYPLESLSRLKTGFMTSAGAVLKPNRHTEPKPLETQTRQSEIPDKAFKA